MPDLLLDTPPPQNIDAEQAALGAMLLEREAIVRAEDLLRPDDFYRDAHRWIYRGILEIFRAGDPVDLITLGEWLKSHAAKGPATSEDNLLLQIGGTLYLTTLMNAAPTAAGIVQYASIVRSKSIQRELIATADELMRMSYQGECDVDALVTVVQQRLTSATERGGRTDWENARIGNLMLTQFERMAREAAEGVPEIPGLFSNIEALNHLLQPGLGGDALMILAGGTSTGKTTAAVANFAWPVARGGGRVLMLSCEMQQSKIALRSFATLGAAAGWQLNNFDFRTKYWEDRADGVRGIGPDLAGVLKEVYYTDLTVLYTPRLTPSKALALARSKQRESGLDLLIIDGLWLMSPDRRMESRRVEIGEITRALKCNAGELNVPTILLHQLSRIKERPDKRPVLEDLVESGRVEQDADFVVFTYRPAFNDPNGKMPGNFLPGHTDEYRQKAWKHYAEFWVRKNRNGDVGHCPAYFDAEHIRFGDWTTKYPAMEGGE